MTPDDVRARLIAGNQRFVDERWSTDEAKQNASPRLRLAVVGCMDARYSLARVLGLEHGDAKIVRTAGPALDEGVRRSLAVATHLLGVTHVAVVGHTDCGMAKVGRGELVPPDALIEGAGGAEATARWLAGFNDPTENVRDLCERIRADPVVAADVDVFGLLYDNASGRVHPIG